ncbi:hypothetical protein EWM64_g2558 [Hericium alpestre]|uniref:Uncharacterized protein n=1 Tax=Hericium alpestre TaxID=135208 RepID=A0A4Z0A557_9AGAM|nr:hypothetical protein EWM64_g2558 [Hericium alpestre]
MVQYAAVRPKFWPILDTWIKPLVDMLKDAYEAMEKHRLEVLASQAKNQDMAEAQTELEDDYDNLDVFVFEFEQDDGNNSAARCCHPDPTFRVDNKDNNGTPDGCSIQIPPLNAEEPWDDETLGGRITFEKFMEVIGESPELSECNPPNVFSFALGHVTDTHRANFLFGLLRLLLCLGDSSVRLVDQRAKPLPQ